MGQVRAYLPYQEVRTMPESKKVPLKWMGKTIGTAIVQPDGTALGEIDEDLMTDEEVDALFGDRSPYHHTIVEEC